MVICIQREKKKSGVHCPVTKKLEALTPPAIDRFLNRHIFCITTPASNTPSGRKKKLLQHSTSFAGKNALRQSYLIKHKN